MLNRIGAVVMVKNESDIIESFARHILQIADFLIVTDHDSTDKTVEILQSLIDEGLSIELQFLHELGQLQAREINRMTHQAFDLGADIVLPMDADEFFVKLDGSVRDVRKIFQKLDPRQSYSIVWNDYKLLAPEKDQARFILDRPLAFDRSNGINKVIVGRESILQNDLYIFRGNHHVVPRRDLYGNLMFRNFEIPLEDENILSLHIPFRSREQFESKYLITWLTHVVLFSKRTMHVEGHRAIVEKILDGEKFSVAADPKSKPIDLSKYRGEVELKFTHENVEPWKNLYRFTEILADRFCRQQISIDQPLVSIFVIHHGNARKTLETLETLASQTYRFIEVHVLPISTENLEPFEDLIAPDFSSAGGKYFYFIPAGDLLAPETVEEFLSILEPQEFIRCAMSISSTDAYFLDHLEENPLGLFSNSDAEYFSATEILQLFLYDKKMFQIDLASFFYRREFVIDSDWLKPILSSGKSHALFFEIMINSVLGGMICLFKNDLISRPSEYNSEDIAFFNESYNRALEFYRAFEDEVE